MPSSTSTKPERRPAKPPTRASSANPIPAWVKLAALSVLLAQGGAILWWLTGHLPGARRNLVPQLLLGGAIILLSLAAYVWREYPECLRPAPTRVGLALLILIAFGLLGVYAINALPCLRMRVDLASWSESYFINDVIRWRTGAPLYATPEDSNSAVYTFAAPMLTYFLAAALGHPASIVVYRLIEQLYLVLAAWFAAAATWRLVGLAMPERRTRLSRAWILFFALASFLVATNRTTNAFNIYLHVDALGILATAVGFWLMTQHAATRNPRWLWAMAAMPALAFLVKQYLAILLAVYVIYLWLEGPRARRRMLAFAAASFALLVVVVAACLLHWGYPFRYWVLQVMGQQVVSFPQMFDRFVDSAWSILLGLLGGAVLLRARSTRTLAAMWIGWVIMVVAANYTAGIAFIPTHLGPATMVGGCFFLAALVRLWPDDETASIPDQWLQIAISLAVVLVVFSGLGYSLKGRPSLPADLNRYTSDIEHEFQGLPTQSVLTDFGDWVYLRDGVVMKDRAAILPVHMEPHFGMIDRLKKKVYAKVLVRNIDGFLPWDPNGRTGIRKTLLANYREVRRIPGVQGMDEWLFHEMLLSDVSVFEPIPGKAEADLGGAAPK